VDLNIPRVSLITKCGLKRAAPTPPLSQAFAETLLFFQSA
jgi:hypothetical protein